MKTSSPTPLRRCQAAMKAGFSLIEVLVSVTILVVVVLIVGMIFQQTSSAWNTGVSKSTAQASIRAIVGAISNDLAKSYDPLWSQQVSVGEEDSSGSNLDLDEDAIEISNHSLSFYIVKDNADILQTQSNSTVLRGISRIEYSVSGRYITRKETALTFDGSEISSTEAKFEIENGVDLKFDAVEDENSEIPLGLRITIDSGAKRTIENFEIAVGSCGPDGLWNTDDDIKPWVD